MIFSQAYFVNRHTGGLEKCNPAPLGNRWVNRHTGGLESHETAHLLLSLVNRHTGGLENARNLRFRLH